MRRPPWYRGLSDVDVAPFDATREGAGPWISGEELLAYAELHRLVVAQAGGAAGLPDVGALESAVAQPRATFAGTELYPSLAEKAAAFGHSLALAHLLIWSAHVPNQSES